MLYPLNLQVSLVLAGKELFLYREERHAAWLPLLRKTSMLDKPHIFPLVSTAGFYLVTQNYVDHWSLTFLEMSYNDLQGLEQVLAQTFVPPVLRYPTLFEVSLG